MKIEFVDIEVDKKTMNETGKSCGIRKRLFESDRKYHSRIIKQLATAPKVYQIWEYTIMEW
jgi:hypothetical protein